MAYESTTFDREATMERMKDRARELMQRARERGSATVENGADLVRRHPGKTVAVSLIAGGILGAVIVGAFGKSASETRWSQLQEVGEDALEKLKEGAQTALCSLRDAIDAAVSKFS
jgi:hypothetical protein